MARKKVATPAGYTRMRALPPFDPIPSYIEYFYDGEVEVVYGEALVPSDKPDWISQLQITNYAIVETGDAEVEAED